MIRKRCNAGRMPGRCKRKTTAQCLHCGKAYCGHHSTPVNPKLGGLPRTTDFKEHLANLEKEFKVLCMSCRGR